MLVRKPFNCARLRTTTQTIKSQKRMNPRLRYAGLLLLAGVMLTSSADAQYRESLARPSYQSYTPGAMQHYAVLATVPTLTYARTQGLASLQESLQDQQLVGAGLAYGTEFEKVGVQLMYLYYISSVIALGGDFIFFFPEKFSSGSFESTQNWMTFNVLARYVFFQTALARIYALAGLNLRLFRVKVSGQGESASDTNSDLGFNIGAGLAYRVAFAVLYLELKYVIYEFQNQVVAAAGVRFPLGGR